MHLLVDSASLYYRSYYALPESMTAPDGRPHNAVRGFLTTMARLLQRFPDATLMCAWDDDWRPTWRTDLIASYKAQRVAGASESAVEADAGSVEEQPETLGPQADAIAGILDAMGVARPGAEGFEADDALATLATTLQDDCVVVSGDRDLVQLVSDHTRLLLTVNGGMEAWPLLDSAGVRDRFGVDPEQYVDLAVLRGDPSDGLPGIKGIGAKTAVALLEAYPGLDELIEAAHGDVVAPMTKARALAIREGAEYLHAARTVATAVRDVPLDRVQSQPDSHALAALAAQWGVQRQVDELTAVLG